MSERKVLNKYFPPDFDPSKIKRRKIGRDPQMVIRLMAPFSMRCNRCGEYVYKGKKFNARKETAQGEEYYGIKIFRFYIKCTLCSSEITFKTDPKNADYTCEHGATRNFENWTESDPTKQRGAMPDAAADDEYDSDGNPLEDKREKDAMADLERSQEQSRREMEMMDELADLRQRNARLELSNANANPDSLLAALHAERETAAEETRRLAEEEEDNAVVRQYFAKVGAASGNVKRRPKEVDGNEKGKGKAIEGDEEADGDPSAESEEDGGEDAVLPSMTIKRRPAPGSGNGGIEPSVGSLLAAKGKVLDGAAMSGTANASALAAGKVKRKREGMQKLMGIKKKVKT